MTSPEILFNFFEYRTGVFLVKAYVVGRNEAGRLVHVHHTAKAGGLGLYNIELTAELERALQLVEALRPSSVAESFRQGAKKPITLPGLLANKHKDREQVIRHVHHRSAEILELCQKDNWAVTLNLDVQKAPSDYLLRFLDQPPHPDISFDFDENGCTYRLGMINHLGERKPIRYHEWKVITNHPTPGWLSLDGDLLRFGALNGDHIKPFRSKDEVRIPADEVQDFWRKFVVRIAERNPIRGTGFDYQEIKAPQRLRISAKLHPFEHRYLIYPEFVYGEKSFAVGDPKRYAVAFNLKPPFRLTRIVRNEEAESELLALLSPHSLHQLPSTNTFTTEEDGRFSCLRWLLTNRQILEAAGVEVVAPEQEGKVFSEHSGELSLEFGDLDDWLDLRARVIVGPHEIPFSRLVRFIQKDERCFPLPDGSIFLIPEAWFTRYRPSLRFAKIEGKKVKMARSQAPLLAPLGLEIADENAAEKAANFTPSKDLKATLRPYQLEGARWLVRHYHEQLGACLADDMGLGKTLQTITVLLYAKENLGAAAGGKLGEESTKPAVVTQMDLFAPPAPDEDFLQPLRALVVLPASLVYNWRHELERFAPSLSLQVHTGLKRSKDARVLRRFDILLTTYQTALRDKEILKEIHFSYIVLDESQQIKNRQSKVFQALNTLTATHRISLSGTPIENSLSDLWSQMQFINPGLLRGYSFFKKEFIDPIEQRDDEKRKAQLRKLVTPHLLRRTKAEVAPDLPELEVQLYYCEMTEAQKKIYTREKSAARNALLGNYAPEDGQYRLKVIQTLTRLRQLSNHPVMLEAEYDKSSGKFLEVLEQWETVIKSGQKVLIFSNMVKHLELFRAQLEVKNEDFAWITGSVSADKREKEVRRFQTDPAVKTFFISIKAGGTGLNLTAADYVFILDPWWNPTIEDQAIARAHRIGRTGSVFARKFITKGTIEEKINRLQQKKKKLAADILSGENKLVFEEGALNYLLE